MNPYGDKPLSEGFLPPKKPTYMEKPQSVSSEHSMLIPNMANMANMAPAMPVSMQMRMTTYPGTFMNPQMMSHPPTTSMPNSRTPMQHSLPPPPGQMPMSPMFYPPHGMPGGMTGGMPGGMPGGMHGVMPPMGSPHQMMMPYHPMMYPYYPYMMPMQEKRRRRRRRDDSDSESSSSSESPSPKRERKKSSKRKSSKRRASKEKVKQEAADASIIPGHKKDGDDEDYDVEADLAAERDAKKGRPRGARAAAKAKKPYYKSILELTEEQQAKRREGWVERQRKHREKQRAMAAKKRELQRKSKVFSMATIEAAEEQKLQIVAESKTDDNRVVVVSQVAEGPSSEDKQGENPEPETTVVVASEQPASLPAITATAVPASPESKTPETAETALPPSIDLPQPRVEPP